MVFKMDTFGDVYLFGDKCNVVKKILITAIKNEKNDLVIVDFSNIKQITPTSANTIFGNLLVEAGISKFKEKVRFRNIDDEVYKVIKYAVNSRLMLMSENGIELKK